MNKSVMRWLEGAKFTYPAVRVALVAAWLPVAAVAQVNSGSNGSDGAFSPVTNLVIDMADHPSGIYQYTSVNISNGVTVTFIPNANNTPVVWLVQSNVVMSGTIDLSGQTVPWDTGTPGAGGPGGFRGGNGGVGGSGGQGLGGGAVGGSGQPAAYGSFPTVYNGSYNVPYTNGSALYGSPYLVPLLGGSGGGGGTNMAGGGGGGGGALLIAANQTIQLNGSISANGGGGSIAHCGYSFCGIGGGGSGGAVRLVAARLAGSGSISVAGGSGPCCYYQGGQGRVRFDTMDNAFGGPISGVFAQGFQPVIIPAAGQVPQLTVTSVGGVAVSVPPSGVLATPDAVLSAQQAAPMAVVVQCANLPLNTAITVTVKPANGAAVAGVGYNTTGTAASSSATVLVNIPRGGGLIYATAATGN